jgi:N-methylhydantoinase A
MIDVVTVGAGGGSIAWLSREGTLKVGPQSAGADPGPMCYGQGGDQPTVTDAHVLLGRIPPHLLGGEVPLELQAARSGVDELAGKLGMTPDACATGILEVSAWNQANALRQVTVKRGLDVRDFHLVTFGGSGSLLGCRLIDLLDLRGVLVPLEPGNLSAYGLLTVDVRNDYVQTAVARQSVLSVESVNATLHALQSQADQALEREGFPERTRRFERTADLRYYGQAFEVRVDVPGGVVDQTTVAAVAQRFHDEHRAQYGYDFRGDRRQEVEWVNLRVTGIGPIRKPEVRQIGPGTGSAETGFREVFFDDWTATKVYERSRLGAGDVVEGPAVLEEFSSTVPLHPGFRAAVDRFGNLLITRIGAAA